MTRAKLLEILEDAQIMRGDYHSQEDINGVLETLASCYGDDDDVIIDEDGEVTDKALEYIREICDSNTPIYNDDRAKWFGENWQAYDDIADELGRDGMGSDIMQGIGTAYCFTLEREALDALRELAK